MSSDPAGGTVTSFRITAFPANATSIVLNGLSYTAATFPAEGVPVPTDANGNPTQTITVDPVNGTVSVVIPFVAIDNAGVESTSKGTAVINFSEVTIGGTVFLDSNGLTDGLVNGTGTSLGGTIYANLVDPATNQVIASVPVNSDGSYVFNSGNGVLPNTSYNIILTGSQQSAGATLSTAALPGGYISTGEDCCDNLGNDGNPNSILAVSTGTTGNVNANFGIRAFTLPLTWLSFTAELQQNRTVLLQWKTTNEVNTLDFIVWRSNDGRNWVNIGSVAALGSTGTDNDYLFIDQTPMEGNNYYRIQQRDLDARSSYSVIRMVKLPELPFSVSVSPNPTPGLVRVNIKGKQTDRYRVLVYNSAGSRLMDKTMVAGLNLLDLSGYTGGTYLVQVIDTSNGELQTFKILKLE